MLELENSEAHLAGHYMARFNIEGAGVTELDLEPPQTVLNLHLEDVQVIASAVRHASLYREAIADEYADRQNKFINHWRTPYTRGHIKQYQARSAEIAEERSLSQYLEAFADNLEWTRETALDLPLEESA